MKNSLESDLRKSIALKASWKLRHDYTHGLTSSKFYTTWRSIKYTVKGHKIGCLWDTLNDFKEDMYESYEEGKRICRLDKNLPFSKDNCVWVDEGDTVNLKDMVRIEYQGESLTLKEISLKYNISYASLKSRYYRSKNYTIEQIIFGKTYKPRRELVDQSELNRIELRAKASKMLAQYRLKDRTKGHIECDLTIEEFIEGFLKRSCIYCGTSRKVGADRVDNNLGHIRTNLVPCCYRCNTMRQDHFTFAEMLRIGEFVRENIDI